MPSKKTAWKRRKRKSKHSIFELSFAGDYFCGILNVMKYTSILVCFLFCSLCSFAQNDTIFFTKSWKPTTTRDSATYFRLKPKMENGLYHVTDYYMSGIPQMVGTFSNIDSGVKEGYFTYYDSVGRKNDEGNYHNGKRTGLWRFYYDNSGQLMYTGSYKEGLAEGTFQFYHSTTGKMYATAEYKNNKLNGESITHFADGKTLYSKTINLNDTTIYERVYDSATGYLIVAYDYNPATDTSYRVTYFPGTKKVQSINRFSDFNKGFAWVYDLASGKIVAKGPTNSKHRNGMWTFYFRGTDFVLSTETYRNDTLHGPVVNYDVLNDKSVKISEGSYSLGEKNGELQIWNPKTQTLAAKKHYLSGSLDGNQEYYYPSGKIKTREFYVNGKRTEGKSYTRDGKETDYQPPTNNASFPGAFNEYKEAYLAYPAARLASGEGKVKIKFTITEDGSITNVKLAEGVGNLWDENALRFVNEMPKWNPANYNGMPIESVCYMTFIYKKEPALIKVTYSGTP